MDIIFIPYHDWRKIQKEGFRTRDSHFIETYHKHYSDKPTVIINRPTSRLELALKKQEVEISNKILLKKDGFRLYKNKGGYYIIDYISKDIISQIFKKYDWVIEKYGSNDYKLFIEEALAYLNIKKYTLLSQNIFAFGVIENLKAKNKIFDAWDNFSKFPSLKKFEQNILKQYENYSFHNCTWICNSVENMNYFTKEFSLEAICLIENGVDMQRFTDVTENNSVFDNIPRPIVGFGGKFTHLIDVDLVNYIVANNKDKSFVFVGQILDKKIYKRIKKSDNFYYLGDIHYDEYPSYVNQFDICIVPYNVEKEKNTGANSIKVYEYLTLEKIVVGTNGNGIERLEDFLFVADDNEEFSNHLNNTIKRRVEVFPSKDYSWESKLESLISIIENKI